MAERKKRSINDSLKKKTHAHTHNGNWTIKTTGRSFEYYKSISFWQFFFFFFISLVGRLRNQIGGIIIERSDLKKRRLSTMERREAHHARQTNRIKQG